MINDVYDILTSTEKYDICFKKIPNLKKIRIAHFTIFQVLTYSK